MRQRFTALLLSATACLLTLTTHARAQYASDFEGLSASAGGTILTGQDAYYIPPATTSTDCLAYTYAGNALGLPANPTGGAQFVAGTGPGTLPAGATFARAQRDLSYGAGTGVWTAGFDICATFTGTLPTAQNLGSFSIQPFPGGQSFIALARWSDTNTAMNWNADYVWFDAAGMQLTETVADPAFQNLDVNKWYRWETDFDLDTNEVVEVRITDIAAATTVSNTPVARYLFGGTASATTPTGFRFFAGSGTVAGNTLAFDNTNVRPQMGSIGTPDPGCSPLANSIGTVPLVGLSGSGLAGESVMAQLSNGKPNEFGYWISGPNSGQIPAGCGIVCIGGPQYRYNSAGLGHLYQFDAAGVSQTVGGAGPNVLATDGSFGPVPAVMVGVTRSFQGWYRDAGCTVMGQAFNFSNSVRVTFN